jgi:phage protein D
VGLTPDWRVAIDGDDITPRIRDRFVSLTVVDGKKPRDDRCTIELFDDPWIDWPENGRKIKVWMGYAGEELTEMGEYALAVPRSKGPPAVLSVTGNAIPPPRSSSSSSTPGPGLGTDSFTYEKGGTVQQLVERAARDLGDLETTVSSGIAGLEISDRQRDETHANYLQRLARSNGFTFKIRNGRLIMTDGHAATGARTGRAVTTVEVPLSAIRNWDGQFVPRSAVSRVDARWHSTSQNKSGRERAGSGRPRTTLPRTYATPEEARRAAAAALARGAADAQTLKLKLDGHPVYMAHTRVDLRGVLRPGVEGLYQVEKATHRITGSTSYETSLDTKAA